MPFGMVIPRKVGQFLLLGDYRTRMEEYDMALAVQLRKVQALVRRSRDDGFTPVLTGHSLGGGIAQTAGAVFGVATLAFSPIGLSYTEWRVRRALGEAKRDDPLLNHVVSVAPDRDVIPALEPQRGTVQGIQCFADTLVDPGACHSLLRTTCELYRKCGDPRGRRADFCNNDRVAGPGYIDTVPWQDR
mmetsp:Transcript_610/g.2010  ORF Transcript_610/g.2010 Transcript_610/m.2010 type:complete len:188 (+) Transcript_610:1464-2027(+)